MSERLLSLTAARIEAELVAARAAEAAEAAARRMTLLLGTQVVCWYILGLVIVGVSWHSTDRLVAGYIFAAGLGVAGICPLLTVYVAWLRELG